MLENSAGLIFYDFDAQAEIPLWSCFVLWFLSEHVFNPTEYKNNLTVYIRFSRIFMLF